MLYLVEYSLYEFFTIYYYIGTEKKILKIKRETNTQGRA